jgi:hypothetical protein
VKILRKNFRVSNPRKPVSFRASESSRHVERSPKTFFPSPIQQSEFVRQNADGSNKTLLFLFAALTIRRGVAKSIVRSFISIARIAGFDGAACAAGKR